MDEMNPAYENFLNNMSRLGGTPRETTRRVSPAKFLGRDDIEIRVRSNSRKINVITRILRARRISTGEKISSLSGGSVNVSTVKTNSGDMTFDSAGDIVLDADGADLIFKDGGTTIAKFINSSSDFVIATDVDDKDFIIKGQDSTSEITALTIDMSAAGAATFNNDVTAFSDERLKQDIQPITGGLEKVMQLQGVTYKRNDVTDAKTQIGVIAQQVEPILPEVVLTAEDEMGTKSVDYAKMTAVLIEAVKELKQEITQLKQQINNGA